MFKRVFFVLLLATVISPARATDYTDIWWNPAESGWGVNLAQNGSFIFATFFIYGSDSKPTWYTGQLTQDPSGKFTGPLFATTGPWFGTVPFNPAQVGINQVGTATFQPDRRRCGRADVQRCRHSGRQERQAADVGADSNRRELHRRHHGRRFKLQQSIRQRSVERSGEPARRADRRADPDHVRHLWLVSCTFAGTATQVGQLLNFPATFTCSDGYQDAGHRLRTSRHFARHGGPLDGAER